MRERRLAHGVRQSHSRCYSSSWSYFLRCCWGSSDLLFSITPFKHAVLSVQYLVFLHHVDVRCCTAPMKSRSLVLHCILRISWKYNVLSYNRTVLCGIAFVESYQARLETW